MGGKNGFPLNSEGVGVCIVLFTEVSLGELILKLCNVGSPVLLAGSDRPASIGLISFESMSVEPYKTNVDSCVGKDRDDLRRARSSSLLGVCSRRTVYGFSSPCVRLSSTSGDVGIIVRSVTSLWCGLS